MIDQLQQLKKILDIPDDYEIKLKNKRCQLPTAYAYPNQNLIVIEGNIPSLVRYALADLIFHEISEIEFYESCPDYTGDSHHHPDFAMREIKYKGRIIEKIEEEHE